MHRALSFRHATVDGRHFCVFNGTQIGHQVVALEDKTEGIASQCGQCVTIETGHFDTADGVAAARRLIETADDVHESGLARPRRTHDCHEFAVLNHQAYFFEYSQWLAARGIRAADAFQFEQG